MSNSGQYSFIFERFNDFCSLVSKKQAYCFNYHNKILYKWGNLTIQIENKSDIQILKELIVEGHYSRLLPINEKTVIIDIGMNTGIISLFFSTQKNISKIYGFEPLHPTLNQATNNFCLNLSLSQKITSFNYGLGTKNEQIKVHYNPTQRGLTSIFAHDKNGEAITIRNALEALTPIFKNHKNEQIIVKIDCEGCEYSILSELDQKLPYNVKKIILEYHWGRLPELVNFFERNKFIADSKTENLQTGLIYAYRPATNDSASYNL